MTLGTDVTNFSKNALRFDGLFCSSPAARADQFPCDFENAFYEAAALVLYVKNKFVKIPHERYQTLPVVARLSFATEMTHHGVL